MYIYKVKIENFRGIKLLDWKPSKDINVIIGENGCGKSTIGIALDYLLNPYLNWYNRTFSEMEYYNRNMDEPISIEVWFKDVKNFVVDDGELLLEHVDDNDTISEYGKNLVLITKLKGDTDGSISHVILSNGKEYPFRQKYKGLIKYKYIGVDRDPLKELSFYKSSMLSRLIDSDKLSDTITDIIDEFNLDSSRRLMENTYFKSSIKKLEDSFSDFNLIDSNDGSIKIEVTELNERKTLQAFSLVSRNNDILNYIPLKYQSRGIKNLMLLLILEEVMKESGVLFLEEPEQNLEPFMQKKIIKKLSSSSNGQMFFTTHSIETTQLYEFENIFLIKSGSIQRLPKLESVDKKFEKHVERYVKRELISGLFSKGVLLVEGDSEIAGIPVFSEFYDKGLDYSGVEVISCGGKDHILKYAKFYHSCQIPVISLVDNDVDIDNLLTKYKKNNIKSLVLKQPKDYESAIITLEAFQDNWIELFEYLYPFKEYKDNYLKPFKNKNSNSIVLKNKFELDSSVVEGVKKIDDIVKILDENELLEFQREFLHLNLADIINVKYITNFLTSFALEKKYKEVIPVAFINMFKIIGVYMNNKSICPTAEKCVVNKILDINWEHEKICCKCASLEDGYNNVLQIKDDSNETQ